MNSKYFISIFFFIFTISTSFGQTLRGKVIDADDNSGVSYASIFFVDLQTGIMADENGDFSFSGQLPREVKLKISSLGYETKIIAVTTSEEKDLEIKLKPIHVELHEVIVSNTTGTLDKYTITNIERKSVEELNVIPYTTLGEAISNIPSIYQSTTGIGISKPIIRGLSGMRVVTYLNGLRIENQQWGGDHGMGVTENGIGEVEVIKGPSSLLYGADALGGVIYFIDEPYAQHNHIETFAETKFESNTMATKNFGGLKIAKNNLRFNVFGNYTNSADYQLPNGLYARNSRFYENNLKAALGYNYKNWVMNIRYNYMENRIGLPGHTHDSIVSPESFASSNQGRRKTIPAQDIKNHYTMVENLFFFNRSEIKLTLGNTYNQLTEFDEKVTIPGIDKILINNLYNARWRYAITENTNFILGSQGMFQQNRIGENATEILIPDANMNDVGIYSLLKTEINTWEFQTGIRLDNRTITTLTTFNNNEPFSKGYSGFNYSAGASKVMKEWKFRGNISSGFRPPHLSELLSDGFHHGALRYEIGDINLKNEKATQVDASAEFAGEHISIVLNPFVNSMRDYIYIKPLGQNINGLPAFNYEQASSALLYGGDIAMHYHPHFAHQFHLEQSFSYVYAEGEGGLALPLTPQPRLNTQVRFEFDGNKKVRFENVSVQHLFLLPQNNVVVYETVSPAYQLINIGANMKFSGKTPVRLKFGIKNLLNETYIDHVSRLKNIGLAAPGINFYVGLRVDLQHKISK